MLKASRSRSSSRNRRKSSKQDVVDVNQLCEQFGNNQVNGRSHISSNGLLSIPRIHVERSSASHSESSWTSNEASSDRVDRASDSETRKSSVSSNASAASAASASSIGGHTHNVTPVTRSQRPSRSNDAPFFESGSKSNRKLWGEEISNEYIYNVYLKKITYSGHNDLSSRLQELLNPSASDTVDSGPKSGFGKDFLKRNKSGGKTPKKNSITDQDFLPITRSDQIGDASSDLVSSTPKSVTQSLLWETRQIRVLKAGTIEFILTYVLLATPYQLEQQDMSDPGRGRKVHCNAAVIEEERNNVAHVMHVLFCCYRTVRGPYELFNCLKSLAAKSPEASKQFNYVLHYWLNNYPDDFFVPLPDAGSSDLNYSTSSTSSRNTSISDSDQRKVIDLVLGLNSIDDSLFKRAAHLAQEYRPETSDSSLNGSAGYSKGSSSCVLELDARFVAQQLTAIDLENFLAIKPHTLLDKPLANPRVQSTTKNFNLLARHVIVTILKAQSPDVVTSHWIEIASQLRRMKNFNSLKAVIAGLTNQSIYRLTNIVWSKLNKQSLTNYKWLSTIVDDVNNQSLLRTTQLDLEGTAKVSLQEESFGTIPYLGTFLTDLTVIDSQFNSTLSSANETKLVNLDKWSKQFEILTQIQLLQKNVRAALTAVHQSQHLSGLSQLPTKNSTPIVPRVARLFRNWFQDSNITTLNEGDCYKLSLALEPQPAKK